MMQETVARGPVQSPALSIHPASNGWIVTKGGEVKVFNTKVEVMMEVLQHLESDGAAQLGLLKMLSNKVEKAEAKESSMEVAQRVLNNVIDIGRNPHE
jgi:hypothetical protein